MRRDTPHPTIANQNGWRDTMYPIIANQNVGAAYYAARGNGRKNDGRINRKSRKEN